MDHLLDTVETGKQCGRTGSTLMRYVKEGKFPPPVYIGSKKFWYQKQITQWLEENIRTTPTYDNLGEFKAGCK